MTLRNGVVENTASAFARAIERRLCDRMRCADYLRWRNVVFHDDTLDRLTEGVARGAKSARAIASSCFKAGKDRIPTLGELLDQVAGSGTPLVIELKSLWNSDETAHPARP